MSSHRCVRALFPFGLAAVAALATFCNEHDARADEEDAATPVRAPRIEKDLVSYYQGERTSAYVVTALGGFAAGAGAALVPQRQDFQRGLGWPLLTLGALEIAGGISYAITCTNEIDHYSAALAKDQAAFGREELDHIHATRSRFIFYRIAEATLALGGAGIAAYGFAANQDAFKGAGIGLATIGVPFVLIDTINNSRAGTYEDHLRRFQPDVGLQLGGGDRPTLVTISGKL
jgi:hypothetical protein